MPIRALITAGTTADCTQAGKLIEGMTAENLLADKGYDSDAIIEQATEQGMKTQILPKRNRKEQRRYGKDIYKLRHLAENAFLHSNDGGESPPLCKCTACAYSLYCPMGGYLVTTTSKSAQSIFQKEICVCVSSSGAKWFFKGKS